jgi:predicted dinucleotide-binding enzyme
MKIGIIGAGNVGTALSTAAKTANHEVVVYSKSNDSAEKLATQTGVQKVSSVKEVFDSSDIVILAVPFDAVGSIVAEAGELATGKVLIDVTNRFDPAQLNGKSNAELIQELVPSAKVVKAFNTIFAGKMTDSTSDGVQLDGFVAGEAGEAKQQVLDFVGSLGFRPVDTGALVTARALEGMGTLNIILNMANNWPWQTGWKLLGPTA